MYVFKPDEKFFSALALKIVGAARKAETVLGWNRDSVEKGVKLLVDELEPYLPFGQRFETLPKGDISILPAGPGCCLIENP